MTQAPTGTRLTEEERMDALASYLKRATGGAYGLEVIEGMRASGLLSSNSHLERDDLAQIIEQHLHAAQIRDSYAFTARKMADAIIDRLTAQGGDTVLQQADSCPPRRRDDAGIGVGTVGSLPPVGAPRAEAAPDAELPPEIEKIAQAWYHEVSGDLPSEFTVTKRLIAANERTEKLIEYIRSLRPQPASPAPTDLRVVEIAERDANVWRDKAEGTVWGALVVNYGRDAIDDRATLLALLHPGKPEGEGK